MQQFTKGELDAQDKLNQNFAEIDLFVSEKSNASLLINDSFQVWQRGTRFTSLNGNSYTADRWNIGASVNLTGVVISKGTYGLKIENPNMIDVHVRQYIEIPKDKVFSENLTLSYKCVGKAKVSLTGKMSDSLLVANTVKNDNCYFYYTDLKGVLGVEFNTRETLIELEYIKIEFGTKATPYIPRPYGTELMLCQRYYENFGSNIVIGTTIVPSTNKHYCSSIPLTCKRVVPTITFTGNPNIINIVVADKSVLSIINTDTSTTQVLPVIDITGITVPANSLVTVVGIADSEIY